MRDGQRPCDAYRVVAPLLPDRYFTQPPPDHGVILAIRGADGVTAEFKMSGRQGIDVQYGLTGRPVQFGFVRYGEKERSAPT